ncbi:SCO2521 family protein [Streptomyces sp. NPDC004012]
MGIPGQARSTTLACGEVRTCLLPTSQALDLRASGHVLRLRADERVLVSERPNLYALSPDTLVGVDCPLPAAGGAKVRAVGTVVARAALTEGRVLQAGSSFRVPVTGPDQRQPWGYYLVRPGVVEPLGKLPAQAVADGILKGGRPGELDPGLIAEGLLTRLLRHPLLDQKSPFKSRRTRLRWAALPVPDGQAPFIHFTVVDDELRTARLGIPEDTEPTAVVRLCEDLALHDWLLTTLVRMLDGSRFGSTDGPLAVLALRPAVDHLLHLWMPRARLDRALSALWEALEEEPGFSRQWQALVQRIRDQLALQAIPLLREALTAR